MKSFEVNILIIRNVRYAWWYYDDYIDDLDIGYVPTMLTNSRSGNMKYPFILI
jgi:hypothetical protein